MLTTLSRCANQSAHADGSLLDSAKILCGGTSVCSEFLRSTVQLTGPSKGAILDDRSASPSAIMHFLAGIPSNS